MRKANEKAVYNVLEASQYLGLGRVAGYEAVRRGVIPSIRVGKRILIPKAALDRWLENCGKPTGPEAA